MLSWNCQKVMLTPAEPCGYRKDLIAFLSKQPADAGKLFALQYIGLYGAFCTPMLLSFRTMPFLAFVEGHSFPHYKNSVLAG
jgi:hypothetical protein